MSRFFCLLLVALISSCDLSPEVNSPFGLENTFVKLYGGDSGHIGAKALQTSDGGFVFAGNTQVVGNLLMQDYTAKMFLVKTDLLGNEQWNTTIDTANQSIAVSMTIDDEGNYLLVGTCLTEDEDGSINYDLRVAKVNTSGESLWVKDYGDTSGLNADFGINIIVANNGDYLVIGHSSENTNATLTNPLASDLYLLRISATDGDIIWQKKYGRISPLKDVGVDLVEEDNGDILWFGSVQTPDGGQRMRLAKANSEGNIIWDFDYPLTSNNQDAGKLLLTNSGYTMMGTINGNYVIIETNKDGALIRNNVVTRLEGDVIVPGDMTYANDGNLLIAGTYQGNSGATPDIVLLKLNSLGEYIWHRKFGAGDLDMGRGVTTTKDNGILISGTLGFESNSLMTLIKTDREGKVSE